MKGQMRHWSCAVGALVLGAVLGFPAQAARNPENMTVSGDAKHRCDRRPRQPEARKRGKDPARRATLPPFHL